jgi:hypothetical protein
MVRTMARRAGGLRQMDARGCYEFLRDEYAPTNQYRWITRSLSSFVDAAGVEVTQAAHSALALPANVRFYQLQMPIPVKAPGYSGMMALGIPG